MSYQLTKLGPEPGRSVDHGRWLAIYRTPIGFIHKVLPMTTAHHSEQEAKDYAIEFAPGPEEYAR